MNGYHSGQYPMNYEISGQAAGGDPVSSAMAAVASTPEFRSLVAKHAAAMGNPAWGGHHGVPAYPFPAHPSHGGPGVAYGGGAPEVISRPLRDIREFPLGFDQTAIAAAANCNVVSRPQVTFRGERLVVPNSPSGGGSNIPASFNIVDLKIGNRSQLPAAAPLSCQAFTEVAVGVRLSMDTAAIAQDVTLIVQNLLGASATFQAILFGTVAQ